MSSLSLSREMAGGGKILILSTHTRVVFIHKNVFIAVLIQEFHISSIHFHIIQEEVSLYYRYLHILLNSCSYQNVL